MNFADNSIEESVLIFPLSQDLHNAMLRIQSRVQKLKETEVLLLKTYKSFVNNDDKDEVTKLTQQLKEMTSEIGYLSDQIESNSLERIRLEKKSNECKECTKNVQKLRDFKGEIEEIKNELIKADQLLISSRKEKTELQAAYEDIRKQYEELKDFDPKEYEAAFADMNAEKEQLTASNDELTRTISSQEAII